MVLTSWYPVFSSKGLKRIYRASNKFSDTLNELFVVNWLISHFFCNNTKWKVVSFPHYLKILLKSTKHGLSYSLKRDWKSISKITFVGGFVLALLIQNSNNFSQKLMSVIQNSIILAWIRSDGWTIFLFFQDNADLNKKMQLLRKFLQVWYHLG